MSEIVTTFDALPLIEPIKRALHEKKYTVPSPIQAKAIPHLLEGKDLVGCAQTGTGKTAAFALPILQRLHGHGKSAGPGRVRSLILTPTRELANQIAESFEAYGRHLSLKYTVVFGGVGQNPQVSRLKHGVDILVATPGRLLDLMQQGHVSLDRVEIFVLDEADRMLDMGFIRDVRKIMEKLPKRRQSLLFSATMPDAIRELSASLLHDPVRVEVTPVASTAERIRQEVRRVAAGDKTPLLLHLLNEHSDGLVLVFVKMKHRANRVVEQLARNGVRAVAIHGNKTQSARERALEDFRSGKTRVLIATDIAARGIDVKGITLVVNYDIPNEPESYVHRIGRTARAGAEGIAIAFCEPAERQFLRDIERLIRATIPLNEDHPYAGRAGNFESTEAQPARPQRPRRTEVRLDGRRANPGGNRRRRR